VLEREELTVQELCGVLRLPQSTVSRHLKTLSGQGWLASRRQGTATFYRFAAAADAGARRLWKLARAETDGWPAAQQDQLRLEALITARRGEAERFFAGAASRWERVRTEAYGHGFEEQLLRALPSEDWTIADLGCGTGAFTRQLAACGARVIGVDQSAAMLRVARKAMKGYDRVELRQGSLEQLPIPAGSCHVATLVLVLSYVADVDAVLGEAFRILAPGGRLFVVEAEAHDDEPFRRRLGQARPGIDRRWLLDTLAGLGFERATAGGPITTRARRAGPDLFLARATRAPTAT
jgi:ArsR family transcriptional regulator